MHHRRRVADVPTHHKSRPCLDTSVVDVLKPHTVSPTEKSRKLKGLRDF